MRYGQHGIGFALSNMIAYGTLQGLLLVVFLKSVEVM